MEEYWYNDSLESIDDEPSTIEYNKEGQAITHRWYDADRNLHRVGAPALVHFDPETEMAVEHEYWTNGVHTNPDGPAYIQFFPRSETAETKVWTSVIKSKNSKGDEVDVLVAARPEGKPGKEVYHRNGLIKEQAWFNYSDPTKVNLNYYSPSNTNDKPAQITFTTDGKRETVSYFLDGSLHRIGGPAFVEYSSEGKTLKQDFYLNGGEVTKERAMEAAKNG